MTSKEGSESVKKITEKSEKARHEFFKKVEKIARSHGGSAKLMQDIADQAAQEYNKVFGRIGVHPLMHVKNGKRLPRYIVDREEVWVIYKPPLWQMGGSQDSWMQHVKQLVADCNSMDQAQDKMLKSDRTESIQEFHGLAMGLYWMDAENPPSGWGFVQRLDVETDGPVICAKTWRSQRSLQVQMKEHILGKAYVCLVHGRIENRIQHVKSRFAELGSDAQTQVMLKHDEEHDPFFDWTQSGKWQGRSARWAESFVKPMAYYHRKEDNSEYSLVYVNILTGITHQVRITLQSLGHPLVSDDRYLPKEVAMSDLKWCPRNFLTEVRSDFFDVCGPHADPQRKQFTRISMQNPLPQLFQTVLKQRLTLVEKLDPTCDLFSGCQYWAIGDEQLMNAYPKDDEYRKKVTRWAIRNGIHFDALDRLLCLPKDDIDELLNAYQPPTAKTEETWLCPVCMGFNSPSMKGSIGCSGYLGKDCTGMRVVDEDKAKDLPKGWKSWGTDPTMHFLMLVNPRWLDARRKVLRQARPAWEKPPTEVDGSSATEDVLLILESALILNAKQGGFGIDEMDLPKVPGLEDIRLPLAAPPDDSHIVRTRLPGRGTLAQWTYTLNGELRLKHQQDFSVKQKLLKKPVQTETDPLPAKMVRSKEEKARREKDLDKKLSGMIEKDLIEKLDEKLDEKSSAIAGPASPEGIAKKVKKTAWKKLESTSNPGNFYYFNAESGENSADKPADFEEEVLEWERIASKSNPGECYYYNSGSGESQADRPNVGAIKNDLPTKGSKSGKSPAAKKNESDDDDDDSVRWKRVESSSKAGHFYYHNLVNSSNEINPPRVKLPWKLIESSSKKGQFYYYNESTRESTEHPPASATPAGSAKAGEKRAAEEPGGDTVKKPRGDKLASGWEKKESDKFKGKFYFQNARTSETRWVRPVWEKKESGSNPGSFYFTNVDTGETVWKEPKDA